MSEQDATVAEEPAQAQTTDDEIRALVSRLARPHRSGGTVVERASLLASGGDFRAAIAWIESHGGTPEAAAPPRAKGGGLHSARLGGGGAADPTPLRFILPAGALA